MLIFFLSAEFAKERGEKTAVDGESVRIKALDAEEAIHRAGDESGNAVLEIVNLANSLDKGRGPQLEFAVSASIALLKNIQDRNLNPYIEKAGDELGNVRNNKI